MEHTAAKWDYCQSWLDQASRGEIILFPPQFYLISLLAPFFPSPRTNGKFSTEELKGQREKARRFLETDGDGKGVRWGEKSISPLGLLMTGDGKSVLELDKPGLELEGSGRRGDEERVVVLNFTKQGPRNVVVRRRREVLEEERGKGKL